MGEAKCGNCGFDGVTEIGRGGDDGQPLITSDAQRLDGVRAWRTLCPRCACVEVHLDPPDSLRRYYSERYDISDAVQNNLIVRDGRVVGKHAFLIEFLFPVLRQRLPERGRFLEIACGSGELTWLFHERWPGWECTGIDPSSRAPGGSGDGCRFIRGYFDDRVFDGEVFDCIVAHGFLNRSPVLPELLRIRKLSRSGTLLSCELVLLEESVFAPHIWDHSFVYTGEALEAYLDQAGFKVLERTQCVSSMHYLCRCEGDGRAAETIPAAPGPVEKTRSLLADHARWWRGVLERYRESQPRFAGKRLALFGAGLYSAVFLGLLGRSEFVCVVDDVKAGTIFFGIPVMTPGQASSEPDLHVVVCCRPAYAGVIARKLDSSGLPCTLLTPA